MENTYDIILNFYFEYQNMSQNHKNGQTTQTSNVKTARLLWAKFLTFPCKRDWPLDIYSTTLELNTHA